MTMITASCNSSRDSGFGGLTLQTQLFFPTECKSRCPSFAFSSWPSFLYIERRRPFANSKLSFCHPWNLISWFAVRKNAMTPEVQYFHHRNCVCQELALILNLPRGVANLRDSAGFTCHPCHLPAGCGCRVILTLSLLAASYCYSLLTVVAGFCHKTQIINTCDVAGEP